jgi:hypothetical protein
MRQSNSWGKANRNAKLAPNKSLLSRLRLEALEDRNLLSVTPVCDLSPCVEPDTSAIVGEELPSEQTPITEDGLQLLTAEEVDLADPKWINPSLPPKEWAICTRGLNEITDEQGTEDLSDFEGNQFFNCWPDEGEVTPIDENGDPMMYHTLALVGEPGEESFECVPFSEGVYPVAKEDSEPIGDESTMPEDWACGVGIEELVTPVGEGVGEESNPEWLWCGMAPDMVKRTLDDSGENSGEVVDEVVTYDTTFEDQAYPDGIYPGYVGEIGETGEVVPGEELVEVIPCDDFYPEMLWCGMPTGEGESGGQEGGMTIVGVEDDVIVDPALVDPIDTDFPPMPSSSDNPEDLIFYAFGNSDDATLSDDGGVVMTTDDGDLPLVTTTSEEGPGFVVVDDQEQVVVLETPKLPKNKNGNDSDSNKDEAEKQRRAAKRAEKLAEKQAKEEAKENENTLFAGGRVFRK